MSRAYDGLGESLGDALLRPTKIYVSAVRAVLKAYRVKRVSTAMAHITGGGLKENLARAVFATENPGGRAQLKARGASEWEIRNLAEWTDDRLSRQAE